MPGRGVLPGNNYHVYDIPLFWANLQADVARRMAAWTPQLSEFADSRADHRQRARVRAMRCPTAARCSALDLGTKTIGTALCDAGWRFATAGQDA